MRLVDRILFPVDFSEACAAACLSVAEMAQRFDAGVTMLSVVETPDLPSGHVLANLASHRHDAAAGRLASFCADRLPGAERLVNQGDAAREIVRQAAASGCNLIMMPTRGAGGIRRFLIGSVTAKVLHDSRCPVWTGVHLDRAVVSRPAGPVLCAVNPVSGETASLQWAAGFARVGNRRLIVVHAMPSFVEGEHRWQAEALEAVEAMLSSESIRADVMLHAGDPPSVVAASAERTGAALVVIGRGSAGGMSGSLKPNAYAIVRSSPCPVVSV